MSLIERDEPESSSHGIALSSSRETDLKIKMYQEAYHHITGKSEKTSFRSTADLLIDFDELKQIHHKILQMCDVHKIIAQSESITVFHSKERKERFTSFERFQLYNKGSTSPTLTIVMQYNFSILPNGGSMPQQYKVTIRLNSRVALMKQMKDEAPPFMRSRLFGFMFGSTADVSVEYADYVIARGFIEAAQEWIEGCKKSKSRMKSLQKLQRFSHLIPGLISFSNGIVITFFFIAKTSEVLDINSSYIDILQYGILFFSSFMLTSKIATFLGGSIESAIDNYTPLSYLRINKGDERVISDYEHENSKNSLHIAFSVLSTIILGVVSSLIANALNSFSSFTP